MNSQRLVSVHEARRISQLKVYLEEVIKKNAALKK